MKQKNKVSKKSNRSFNPKLISIRLADALKSDLEDPIKQVSDPKVASYYKETQIKKFLTKFPISDSDSSLLEREAFDKFLQTNEHMKKVNDHFRSSTDSPVALFAESDHDLDLVLRRARALAHFVLTPVSEDEFFMGCKSSGGSSIGVPFSNTSPERKYTYPLSVSSKKLEPLWHRYLLFNPEFARSLRSLNKDSILGDLFERVGSSRATTVEKNETSRRMIAVEPVVNMFFQQGLMSSLTRRLLSIGLDLTNVPQKHKELAFESSITASFDTVDFSSASDCVSSEFLRWLIPAGWFAKLNLVRSPSMTIEGETIELEMISTMGNATTFPIETLVFWCIAVSSVMTISEPNSKSTLPNEKYFKTVSVFGDDCITPRNATALFMAACTSVGFIVNHDKSFFNGGIFRESCGGDYLRGYNVRPVYLRGPTSTKLSALEPWLYAFANGIIKKYISYFGSLNYVYDKELFRLLFRIFKENQLLVKVVPSWYPDDSGLKIGEEIHRFQTAYDISFSRISLSDQGVYSFSYCKFNYRVKENWDDYLRYSLFQKQRVGDIPCWLDGFSALRSSVERTFRFDLPTFRRELKHEYSIRRLGGYVVAKGFTPCWTVSCRHPT